MRIITKFLPSLNYVTEMINTNQLARLVLTIQFIDADRTVVIFRTDSYNDYQRLCECLGDVAVSVTEYFS